MEVPHGPERKQWRETLSEIAVTRDGELLIRPPSRDPLQLSSYPAVPGVTHELYQLSSAGLSSQQVEKALQETQEQVDHVSTLILGFQGNEKFHHPFLSQLCHIHIANEGNPFEESKPGVFSDTKWLERNVLDYFASLWHAKWPHNPSDPESYWGYLLPIGVTEANIFSVCTARDYLSGMFVVPETPESSGDPRPTKCYLQGEFEVTSSNAHRPVGFYSADAHYGVMKGLQVCDIPSFHEVGKELYPEECPLGDTWPIAVPCENGDAGSGGIDVNILTKLVDFFSAKGHPIIIVFNYGSTFKGAYDDVEAAHKSLLPILKKNGMYERKVIHPVSKEVVVRKGFWFHVDAALAGMYMPFVEIGHKQGLILEKPGPVFDFRLESVASIASSIAKHVGAPWPCGVYITKTGLQLALSAGLEPTFSGSRNGHIAPLLWSHFSSKDFKYQVQKIADILSVADYSEKKMRALEQELGQDLWVSRTRLSLAIYFKRPNSEIFRKYSLSAKTLFVNGELRDYVHIYIMHHVQRETIDSFVEDLKAPGAFPTQGCN